MTNRVYRSAAVLVVSAAMAAGVAQAGTIYGFTQLTSNGGVDVAGQLTMEVTLTGAHHVEFTFRNAGAEASSITGIYFDDGSLLGSGEVMSGSAGAEFVPGAAPRNLPGGNGVGFNASSAFGSTPPRQPHGIGPGEMLTIRFDLLFGQSALDTFSSLALALANPESDMVGGLRVGLHVQGYAGGQSESFVNSGAFGVGPAIPLPGAAAMGLVGLATVARRRGRALA